MKAVREINTFSHDDSVAKNIVGKNNTDVQENSKVLETVENKQSFYDNVKSQIDGIFNRYESEPVLSNIIPNSKWAKVNYDGDENYYVLGLIFNDESMQNAQYICYGVPSKSKENPPDDIKDIAQWVPININDINSSGYFI